MFKNANPSVICNVFFNVVTALLPWSNEDFIKLSVPQSYYGFSFLFLNDRCCRVWVELWNLHLDTCQQHMTL